MRINWIKIATGACLAVATILVAVPLAIILRHPKIGRITGQVIDARGSVPRARVIVTFSDWHLNPILDTDSHAIGIESDENGKFSLAYPFTFRVGQIVASACSPSNELGWTQVREPRDSSETVFVHVGRRVDIQWRDQYQYNYFRTHASVTFVGEGWPPPPSDSYFEN